MTEIDRRAIITGLVAAAAAGVAPALPIHAEAAQLLRIGFGWRPGYDVLPERYEAAVIELLRGSTWLYDDGRFFDRWSIRHLSSGLTFRQASPHTPRAWAVELDHIETTAALTPTGYAAIHPIGYAAVEVMGMLRFLQATSCKPQPAPAAILIRYSPYPPYDPNDFADPLSFEAAAPLRVVPFHRVLTMPYLS